MLCLTECFSCTLNGDDDCAVFVFIYLIWVCLCVCKVSLSWRQKYVTVHTVWILMLRKIYRIKCFIVQIWQFTPYQYQGFPTKEGSLKDINVNLSELDFSIFRQSCSETTHYLWIFDYFLQWYVKPCSVCKYNVL